MSLTYEQTGPPWREIRRGVGLKELPLQPQITCPGMKNPRHAAKNNIQHPMAVWMQRRSGGNIEAADGGNNDGRPRQTSCEEGGGGC